MRAHNTGIRIPQSLLQEAAARWPQPTLGIKIMAERYIAMMYWLRAELSITPEELATIAAALPRDIPAWGIQQLWNYMAGGEELGPIIKKLQAMPTAHRYAIADAVALMREPTVEEARRVLCGLT